MDGHHTADISKLRLANIVLVSFLEYDRRPDTATLQWARCPENYAPLPNSRPAA